MSFNGLGLKGKIFAFDLDDTLGHYSEVFNRHMHYDVLNLPGKEPDIPTNYDMLEPWRAYGDFDHLEMLWSLEKSGRMVDDFVPTEIAKLPSIVKSNGGHVFIVTARSWMKDPRTQTEAWLKRAQIPYDDIIFCEIHECKSKYLPEGTSVYVEDHPKHIENCIGKVPLIAIADRPWNRHLGGPGTARLPTRLLEET